MESKKAILPKLFKIQQALKVGKNKKADAGRKSYDFRSAVDILEALKPLLEDTQTILEVSDKVVHYLDEGKTASKGKNRLGDVEVKTGTMSRFYILAKATLYDIETGESISSVANARESDGKLGMEDAQLTGSTSSYARKYALGGLFGLDDSKDPDEKGGNK